MNSHEVPIAHPPHGGWHGEMPAPILDGCDEALDPGLPDFRGLWQAFEESGNRVVITAGGVIHDMGADGTLENGLNDVSARGGAPISVAARFEDAVLMLRPNDAFVAVTRSP